MHTVYVCKYTMHMHRTLKFSKLTKDPEDQNKKYLFTKWHYFSNTPLINQSLKLCPMHNEIRRFKRRTLYTK